MGEHAPEMRASIQLVTPEAAQASGLSDFELELARLIATVVNLDVSADEIAPDEPLFGQGLGLDSIDLLEIALAVSQTYGFALRSDDPDNQRIFSSLRAFANHIALNRKS
jgi:acyl carrier protein